MAAILLTKLRPPSIPQKHVRRPSLVRRLDEGLDAGRQLTLVSAPAGFGKTVCVSEWIESVELPVAWLSLETADDDPVRFFLYLVAALQHIDRRLGQEIEGILRAGQLPPGDIISATLSNDILALDGRFLLVLDDFQVVQDRAILQVLQTVVVNTPPALHLVLITREEPSLPLARLRANNQMTEIRAADLRFRDEETARFLNETMGLALDRVDIAALEDKTEGWVAGLQLAALSMRDRPHPAAFIAGLSGSHRHILSYLTEEVLNRQPPPVQRFLLQTSILDKLRGDLCDVVAGGEGSRALLEELYNDNLFLIPLDDERQWYRYHQLFADLLRDRQEAIYSETTAELHRRASRWYAEAGMPGQAIQHALDGEAYEAALALIEKHYMDRLMGWHARTVKGWMQAIPAAMVAGSVRASLAFAWMHLMSNELPQALPYIERLRAMFARPAPGAEDPALRAEWLALQAMLLNAQGQPDESLTLANEALAIVPEDNAYVRSLVYGGLATAYMQKNDAPRAVEAYQQLIAYGRLAGSLLSELMGITGLALYAIERGELQFAFDLAQKGIASVERSGTLPPISGALYGEIAAVYNLRGQFVEAERYFMRAAQVSRLSGYSDAEVFYHVVHSRQALIEGDMENAAREINMAVALTEIEAPTAVREEVIAQRVRVALARNQPLTAEALLEPHGFAFRPQLSVPDLRPGRALDQPAALLLLSALRILQNRVQKEEPPARGNTNRNVREGMDLAHQLIGAARSSQLVPVIIETLLMRAQMHDAAADEHSARVDLAAALKLAEPQQVVAPFLEQGVPLARMLSQLVAKGNAEDALLPFAATILAAFPEGQRPEGMAEPLSTGAHAGLIEPLSARELEILRLVGQGNTNQEIADRLVVTLHTVKKHNSNIYSKLGVRNRTQAVARARELRLL